MPLSRLAPAMLLLSADLLRALPWGVGLLAASAMALGLWSRRSPGGAGSSGEPAEGRPAVPSDDLLRRNRELEALAAVAATIARGADLATTADETLGIVCSLAGVPTGAVHRLDSRSQTLVLVAQRGLTPEEADVLRQRPVVGSFLGRAVLTGGVDVTSLEATPPAEPRLRELARRRGHRMQVAVPIPVKDEVWGVLSLVAGEAREVPGGEVEILKSVARQVGVALERATLLEEAAARHQRLETLARLGRELTATLSLGEVAEATTRAVVEIVADAAARLWLIEEGRLVVRAEAGVRNPESLGLPTTLDLGEGLPGLVARTRETAVTEDIAGDPRLVNIPWMLSEGFVAEACVPLVARERLLGVLAIFSRLPGQLGAPEVEMLGVFASHAATAIENARLFAEAQQRAAEYRALFEVGRLIGSTLHVEQVLEMIAERCRALMGVRAAGIFRMDETQGGLVYDRGAGLSPEFIRGLRIRPGEGTTGRAFAQGVPIWSADLFADPAISLDEANRALVAREGYRATLSVPIVIKGRPHGALAVYWWEPHVPTAAETEVLSALAAQAAIALDNARLFEAAEMRAARLLVLARLGQVVSSSLDTDEVLGAIARAAAELMSTPGVVLWVADEAARTLDPRAFSDAALTADFPVVRLSFDEGAVGWVAKHRQPFQAPDIFADHRFIGREWWQAHGLRSFLAVPILHEGAILGVLELCGREPFDLGPDDRDLLDSFVAQAAAAFRNSSLHAETRRRLEETRALLEVSEILNSPLKPRQLLKQACITIARVCQVDRCTIERWEGDRVVPLMSQFADGRKDPAQWASFASMASYPPREVPAHALAIETRRPVVIQDAEHTDLIPREWVETYGHKSYLCVPLIRRDEVIGVLNLDNCEREGGFAPWQADRAMAVAGQLALAIENAELAEQTRARLEELSVLHELSRAVTGQLDQAGLLDAVRQQVARVLNVSHVLILLHDETRDEMEAVLRVRDGIRIDGEPRWYPARGAGLTSVIMATGSPVRTDDYAGECARRGVAALMGVVGRPHWLGAPMTAGDRVLGVLALGSPERPFTEDDERLLANIAQLAALAIRSARLFEERTRAYEDLAATQDQLVRTEKLRALGEMASGVAHDFNNMLAVIVGRAQLMLAEIQDPRHRRWLQVIERSALDGAQTVRRLQEFSRVRRDQPFVAVSVNRIVEEALEATSPRWQEEPRSRGIVVEVSTRLNPDLPPAAGDPAELREALTNLILNAVDAMPQGGTLTLETRRADGRVELLVSDTGVGMPEDVRERIFDPFFTTKGPQGTGLGLAMTYGILSRHDARVTVESEEGRGTTFRLSFAASDLPAEPRIDAGAPRPAGPLRCLVVDDELDVGEVLGDVLASAGHTAVVVGSGVEAIERFQAERFDVVFTDLAMPGLTGWEVARRIKGLAPGMPVFLVTGFGVEVSAEEMKAKGVDAVLPKPLRIQDTLAALAQLKEKQE